MDSTTEKLLETIKGWFRKHECGGLILPSGWFGRPHDNLHSLSRVTSANGEIVLTLDEPEEELCLTFINLKNVISVGADESGGTAELHFDSFERFIFERKDYGNGQKKTDSFSTGIVKFVSPQGI